MTRRIDALDPTVAPQRDHEVPAMRDGISNRLRVEQILGLLQSGDIPAEAVTLAKLSADARAAGNHTYDNATSGLTAVKVQDAIDEVVADLGAISIVSPGHIFGLTLSNNTTDATNDIDIAAGEAASDDASPALIALASAITKRLDAAWAVGTGNGGLDTGSIANTTYHVWLIRRSDTGVVDVLFSTSATAPTMPTSYDQKRRIGAIIRAGGAIRPFIQTGDKFQLKAPVLDVNVSNPGTTAVLRTLSVPAGRKVEALLDVSIGNHSGVSNGRTWISDPDTDDIDPATAQAYGYGIPNFNDTNSNIQVRCSTNASNQIRTRAASSSASTSLSILTRGWIDTRGRND